MDSSAIFLKKIIFLDCLICLELILMHVYKNNIRFSFQPSLTHELLQIEEYIIIINKEWLTIFCHI